MNGSEEMVSRVVGTHFLLRVPVHAEKSRHTVQRDCVLRVTWITEPNKRWVLDRSMPFSWSR